MNAVGYEVMDVYSTAVVLTGMVYRLHVSCIDGDRLNHTLPECSTISVFIYRIIILGTILSQHYTAQLEEQNSY